MTYTAPEVLTFIAALGVLITGVGAVIVNIIVALRTGAKVDESLTKTDGLVAQVREVHTLTNSNLSAVKAELATAGSQITALRELVQDLKSEREKKTGIIMPPFGSAIPAEQAVHTTLDKIEINTEETASNTKRTDVAIAELKKDK